MNVESFIINGENMLGKHSSVNGVKYSVSELINVVKTKKTHENKNVLTFMIKYTVPNTAYVHAPRYEYDITRFDDIDQFIDKYIAV